MRKGEADHIEGRHRSCALERKQGDVPLTHEVGHVFPGEVGPLAGDPLGGIELVVEDGKPQVGLSHLVGVGIDQAGAEGPVLPLVNSPLATKVASGPLHPPKKRLNELEAVLPLQPHVRSPSSCRYSVIVSGPPVAAPSSAPRLCARPARP